MKKASLIFVAIAVSIIGIMGIVAHSSALPYPTGVGGTGTSITPASGTIPIGNGSGSYTPAFLTPGTNIQITNGSGTVTIAVTGTATGTVYLLQSGHGISLSPSSITASGTIAVNTSTVIADVVASGQFLPSSTLYVASVNGQSGVVTIGIPATTTINAAQATVFRLIGDGTTVTSTVNGATTTFSIINTGNWAGTWQNATSGTYYPYSNPLGFVTSTGSLVSGTSTYVGVFNSSGTLAGYSQLTWDGDALTLGATTTLTPTASVAGYLTITGSDTNGAGIRLAGPNEIDFYDAGGNFKGYLAFYSSSTFDFGNAGSDVALDNSLLTGNLKAQFPAGDSGLTDTFCFQNLANCGSGISASNTQVIFMNGTTPSGDPNFIWTSSTQYLTLGSSSNYAYLGFGSGNNSLISGGNGFLGINAPQLISLDSYGGTNTSTAYGIVITSKDGAGAFLDTDSLTAPTPFVFPDNGGATSTFCIKELANCGGSGGGVATTSPFTAGFIPVVSSSLALTNSNIYSTAGHITIGNGSSDLGSTLGVAGNIFDTASSPSIIASTSVAANTATMGVYAGTAGSQGGGFFRAYGSGFGVASLAQTVGFGADTANGSNGIVVFGNSSNNSGAAGYVDLRGGGYDTAATNLHLANGVSEFKNFPVVTDGALSVAGAFNASTTAKINGTTTIANVGVATSSLIIGTASSSACLTTYTPSGTAVYSTYLATGQILTSTNSCQ